MSGTTNGGAPTGSRYADQRPYVTADSLEATNPDDLTHWLNAPTLILLWPDLVLPPQVRQPWEARFPQLRANRRPAAQ